LTGSVAIYYFTKEPDEKKSESLIYSLQQTASFKGGKQHLTFSAIGVANEGGVAAKRVFIAVALKEAEIRDLSIDASAGSREVSREIKSKRVQLGYETLLPGESIMVNLLLSSPEKPSVSVRSDATFGIERPFGTKPSPPSSRLNELFEYLVPLTGALFAVFSALAVFLLRRHGYLELLVPNRNNAGFLLLHHGLVDDAEVVLTGAMHSGNYDPFTLSNLALCKALKGKHEPAKQLIRAANFRETVGHTKAVTLFNEALMFLTGGNKNEALAKLREAIAMSPTDIRRYCQHSVHLDAVRNDPAFYELIKDLNIRLETDLRAAQP
jgi:hypothetical protein